MSDFNHKAQVDSGAAGTPAATKGQIAPGKSARTSGLSGAPAVAPARGDAPVQFQSTDDAGSAFAAFGEHLVGNDIKGFEPVGDQGPNAEGQKALAKANHLKQQARVYNIVNQAFATKANQDGKLDDFATMLHYTAEWIVAGKCTLTVLTPIHDSKTRVPGTNTVFDPTVVYPAVGGDYPADPNVKSDPRLAFVEDDVGGKMDTGGAAFHLTIMGDETDQIIKQRLIHEVQHDADQSFPGQDYAEGPSEIFDDYRSEYRAFAVMSGDGSGREGKYGSPDKPAKNDKPFTVADPDTKKTLGPVATKFRSEYQENFSRAMMTVIPKFGREYVNNPVFKSMVDAYDRPAGGNNLNSIRIDGLREAVNACSGVADDDPAVAGMEAAAGVLEPLERKFLQDKELSRPFWTHAEKTLSANALRKLEIAVLGKSSQPLVYIVKAGDWLAKIAKAHGVPLSAIFKANPHLGPPVRDWNKIFPGDKVFIPSLGTGTPGAAPPPPATTPDKQPGGQTKDAPPVGGDKTGDATKDGAKQAQQFVDHGLFGPEEIIPSTGKGGFTASYDPALEKLGVELRCSVDFVDALVGEPTGVVTPGHPNFAPIAAKANAMPAGPKTSFVAGYQWDSGEHATWLGQLEHSVETMWSGHHSFFVRRAGWEHIDAHVAIDIKSHAGKKRGTDHLHVDTVKMPQGENLYDHRDTPGGDRRHVSKTGPGDADDGQDQTMQLSSTDVGARPQQHLKEQVFFATNSAWLDAKSRKTLREFVGAFQGAPEHAASNPTKVELIAHSSAVGDASYNQMLAQKRAEAVRGNLVQNGFTNVEIRSSVDNRGESEAKQGDRPEDRRVDLLVDGGEQQNLSAHEFGHAFGLGDEYGSHPQANEDFRRIPDAVGSDAAHDEATKNMKTADGGNLPGAIHENNGNIMSLGNAVKPQHYSTFYEALTKVTKVNDWALGNSSGDDSE